MKAPLISVVLPVFNSENTIIAALDSVKNQTGNYSFEIIIINDGSTDCTQKIVENYQTANPQLQLTLIQQDNKGVSAARNTGIKIAKGKYIAFLDSDDVWLPEKTATQIPMLENPSLGIDFLAACSNHDTVGFPYRTNPKNQLARITLRKILIKNTAPTPTCITKKSVFEKVGYFDEQQRYAEDANLWLKIADQCAMYILNKKLVITGSGKKPFGESGLSGNLCAMEKGFQKNLKEMLHLKKISLFEYFFFYIFSKIKYISRPIRMLWH